MIVICFDINMVLLLVFLFCVKKRVVIRIFGWEG